MKDGRNGERQPLHSAILILQSLLPAQKTKRPGLTAQTGPPEGELRTFRSADVTAARLVPLFDPGVLRLDAALHSSATTLTNVSRQSN